MTLILKSRAAFRSNAAPAASTQCPGLVWEAHLDEAALIPEPEATQA